MNAHSLCQAARLALGVLGLALLGLAQETRGTLTGTVTDPSGAAIAGAKLTALNMQTNVASQGTTSADGSYLIPYLLPGPYSVTVESQGFKKLVRQGLELRISERVTLDLKMEIGATQESINVTGDAPLLEVSTATSGQVIDRRRIAELPLAEGNPMTLIQLAPGIVVTGGWNSNSALSNSGPSNFEVNGSPGGNEYTLDGTPNTADRQGQGAARVGLQPPTDAVEEFKVVTAGFDAQQGRTAGGSVDVAVKSGTNEFHGSAYEFVRNDVLMANSFFFNREGRPKQARRYNRFGGTVGGPIGIPKLYNGKDKTFFFTSLERIRPITPNIESITVPNEAFRRGDFSALLNRPTPLYVYDPRTARVEGARVVRDPIQCNGRINVICPDRISPIAANYLSFLPLPTDPNSITNNYSGNGPGDNTYDVFLARVDHIVSEKHRIFGRYSQGWRTEQDENSAGTINGVRINGRLGHRGNKGGVVDYIYVPSGSTILNLRAGYTRFKQDRFSLSSYDYDVTKMGFSPQALALFTANTLPQISVSNFSSPVEPTGYLNTNPTWSLQPTLTRIQGSHSLRFGYDYRVYQQNRADQTFKAGQYTFNNDFTRQNDLNPSLPIEQLQAQGMAALLLGQPTGGNFPLLADNAATALYNSFYVQDDWKVNRRLTLNLGLRYEIDHGTTERFNRMIRDFDPSVANPTEAAVKANYARNPIPEIAAADFRVPGILLFADENDRPAFKSDKNNFQARIGGAFRINDKTAIRGGWGMFMVPFFMDGINQNGFTRNTPLVASPDRGLTFSSSLANPFPSGYIAETNRGPASLVGQNPGTIVPSNRINGMVYRWEVSLQRELPGRWLVEGAYIGNTASNLAVGVTVNAIPRQYQSTSPVRDQALINFLDTPVTNPFRGVAGYEGTNLYAASVINRSQLLRPYPQFTNLSRERYDGASSYHAMQLRAEKRFSKGYTLLATYAWSKYLEEVSLLNPTDDRYERRLSDADSPHRLAMSGIYELPFGRGRQFGSSWSGVKEALLGGFQLQGILQYQAGRPLTLGNVYFNGNLSDITPTITSSTIGVIGSTNIQDNVFLTNIRTTGFYFQDDAVKTNGQLDYNKQRNDARINLGQNIRTLPSRASNFRNQGNTIFDVSLIKNFALNERVKLQFRAEAINSLNKVHFNGPVLNPRDTNFGRVTNSDSPTNPREFQLGLRLVF